MMNQMPGSMGTNIITEKEARQNIAKPIVPTGVPNQIEMSRLVDPLGEILLVNEASDRENQNELPQRERQAQDPDGDQQSMNRQ
jgi:hypothetical protein